MDFQNAPHKNYAIVILFFIFSFLFVGTFKFIDDYYNNSEKETIERLDNK